MVEALSNLAKTLGDGKNQAFEINSAKISADINKESYLRWEKERDERLAPIAKARKEKTSKKNGMAGGSFARSKKMQESKWSNRAVMIITDSTRIEEELRSALSRLTALTALSAIGGSSRPETPLSVSGSFLSRLAGGTPRTGTGGLGTPKATPRVVTQGSTKSILPFDNRPGSASPSATPRDREVFKKIEKDKATLRSLQRTVKR